jgi:hypothetical protein
MDTPTRNIVFLSGSAIVSISVGAMVNDLGLGWALFGTLMLVASLFSWFRHG